MVGSGVGDVGGRESLDPCLTLDFMPDLVHMESRLKISSRTMTWSL